jgi:hypothetical protein
LVGCVSTLKLSDGLVLLVNRLSNEALKIYEFSIGLSS